MKHIKYLAIVLFLFVGCDAETPTETVEKSDKEISEYFSYQIGNVSTFMFSISDKFNNEVSSGERISTLIEQRIINSKKYFVFSEILNSQISETFLRFNGNILLQYADTSGAFELIPDSMRSALQLDLSLESDLFKYPLTAGESWNMFTTSIVLGTYKIKAIDIEATYFGEEQVELGSAYGIVNADKVNYSIVLNIPDMSNPLISNIQKYSAEIYFSKGLGIVKFSGSKFFTNFLVGREINLNDTLFVENQVLK